MTCTDSVQVTLPFGYSIRTILHEASLATLFYTNAIETTRTSPPHLSPSSVSDPSPLEANPLVHRTAFTAFLDGQETVSGRQLKHRLQLHDAQRTILSGY